MPEIIIKYSNPKTLQALKDFSKYFDFVISFPKKKKEITVNEVTIIPGDSSIDISELEEVFTGKNICSKDLRMDAWKRRT